MCLGAIEVRPLTKSQNPMPVARINLAKQNAKQLHPGYTHMVFDSLEELLDLDDGAVVDVELGQDPIEAQLRQARLGFRHPVDGLAIRGVVEKANLYVILLNHRRHGALVIPLLHGVHFCPFSRAGFLDTKVFLWELSQ